MDEIKVDVDFEYELEPGCRCFSCYTSDYETIRIDNLSRRFSYEEFKEIKKLIEEWAKDKKA